MISRVVFLSRSGFSRHRSYLQGRSQPRCAARDGSSVDRRGSSRETKTIQSSRYLPNDGAAPELADDRTGDGAIVPATSDASAV